MKDSLITTVERLGYLARLRRREKGLSQAALADLLGVERKWVLKFEAGNAGAELALVLKVIAALDLHLILSDHAPPAATGQLDEVFRRLARTDEDGS